MTIKSALIYRNWADDATLSAGSWVAGLPLTNLLNQQPTKVARSADAALASTKFDVDLTGPRSISLVSLLRHNLENSARWRFQISNVANFSVTVHDSGWADVWPAIQTWGQLSWCEFQWDGRFPAAEAQDLGPTTYGYLPTAVVGRYVRIEIDDTINGDGYVQAGRLYVAPAWFLGVGYDWAIQYIDESRRSQSRGGQRYVDAIPKRRRITFLANGMTKDEAYVQAFDAERLNGISGDVVFVPDIADVVQRIRQGVYGTFSRTSPLPNEGPDHYTKSFHIDELL